MNKDEKFGRAEAPGRSEDARLLTGKGRFTADLDFPDMVHAVFVRSPYGHADIKNIDLAEATAALGVVGVFTADDFPNIHSIPCARVIFGRDGRELVRPDRHPLAKGRVRHVGECVAVVIAETKALAEDAADLVMIDYAPLEAVARPERAIKIARHNSGPKRRIIFFSIGIQATKMQSTSPSKKLNIVFVLIHGTIA